MTRRTTFRIKTIGALLVLFLFCSVLSGCTDTEPSAQAIDWPQSTNEDKDFAETGVIMETELEVFGPEDKNISYILLNTTQDPVSFGSDFSLEYNMDGTWLTVPFASEISENENYTLPGLQASRIDVNLSLFSSPLPEGQYRIVRKVGNALQKAEFAIAGVRIDAREMTFGHKPLSSLPADYDGIDAQNDGYYTILEDGVFNQEVVQFFCDRVHLGVPAKLRTVMHTAGGAVHVRDIIFAPDSDGNSRFFVILDDSRRTVDSEQLIIESVYSSLSVAKVGNKHKVCLSNYVSHIGDAPAGAPLELLSPDAADNIDLVATIELRTEENVLSLPHKFLVFGPDDESFVTIARGGKTFGYSTPGGAKTGIEPGQAGVTLTVIKWVDNTQLSLFGVTADGQIYQGTYEIETDM